MSTLHLKVDGGLCSRMRAVIGAIAFCDATDRELVVHWSNGRAREDTGVFMAFPPRMSDMWEHPFEETHSIGGPFRSNNPDMDADGDIWLMTVHLTFFKRWLRYPISQYWMRLRLHASLQEMVRGQISQFRERTIGVMIRNWLSFPDSKLPTWYIDKLRSIVADHPDVGIYLAADAPVVDEAVYDAFPGRVTSLKHGTDYAWDYEGIRRAAVDLYILAATDWFIGSNQSSYCQMVALMRGADLGKHDAPNGIPGGNYEDPLNPGCEFLRNCKLQVAK